MEAEFDLNATDDVRVLLLMTNTTADTEEDVTTVAGFTTLDNFDGSGYTTNGHTLDSEVVAADNANNRGEFDAADEALTTIGAGTRSIQAALYIKWTGTLNGSIPLAFVDTGGFPFAANGGDITFQFNAEGLIQTT